MNLNVFDQDYDFGCGQHVRPCQCVLRQNAVTMSTVSYALIIYTTPLILDMTSWQHVHLHMHQYTGTIVILQPFPRQKLLAAIIGPQGTLSDVKNFYEVL